MRRSDGTLIWCRVRGQTVDAQDPAAASAWSFEALSQNLPDVQRLNLIDHLGEVTPPGMLRSQRHELLDILAIALCAVTGWANHWIEGVESGESQLAWFPTLLKLPNGIDSHVTFARECRLIDANALQKACQQWLSRCGRPKNPMKSRLSPNCSIFSESRAALSSLTPWAAKTRSPGRSSKARPAQPLGRGKRVAWVAGCGVQGRCLEDAQKTMHRPISLA